MRSSPVLLIIIFLGSGSPFHLLSSRLSRSSTLPSRQALNSIKISNVEAHPDSHCPKGPPQAAPRAAAAAFLLPVILSASLLTLQPLPSIAAYGPSGAVVNSPPVVKSLSLEEFLNLSKAKQRQFEGSFVSCTTVKGAKQCKPVSVIDGLLNDMKAVSWTRLG